ncbi:MAG: Core histone macro-H2A.1 [Paramarteilia canceri]
MVKASKGSSQTKTSTRTTLAQKCGTTMPVTKIIRMCNSRGLRMPKKAAACLAGITEYVTAELLELSSNWCKESKQKSVDKRHVMYAVIKDDELNKLFNDVQFIGTGIAAKFGYNMKVVRTAKAEGQ